MTDRKDDPDLAPDAALATDLGDEDARRKEQLAYYGGEIDPDVDEIEDDLDDGSNFTPGEEENAAPPAESQGNKETQDEDDKEAEEAEEEEDSDADDDVSEDADEDQPEEDDEESEEEDDEGGDRPQAKKTPQGIPKSRFDEVNERRKAAEAELEQLRAQMKAAEQSEEEKFDFVKAEREYAALILDGDEEGAANKRAEIRAAERAEWQTETKQATKEDLTQEQQVAEVRALSKQAEEMFPEFDPESEHFNSAYVDKTLIFYNGYLSRGSSPGDAFVEAVADAVELFGLTPPGDNAPQPDPEPKPTGKKRDDEKTRAAKDAKKRAHQPVAEAGVGSAERGAVVPNINDMTDEELDALPEKTLARMRGDIL